MQAAHLARGSGETGAISFRETIAALSFALDLSGGLVPGHAVRSCLLAARIGEALSLPAPLLADLAHTALLKDLGCSRTSSPIYQLVGGDDRETKAAARLLDWRRVHRPNLTALEAVWQHMMPGKQGWNKAARLLRLAASQRKHGRQLVLLRAEQGAALVRSIGLREDVALGVRHLDDHWDGGGMAAGPERERIPLLSRIVALTQTLDAFCMRGSPGLAISVALEGSGRWFDPELVRVAHALHREQTLWTFCVPGRHTDDALAALQRRESPTPSPLGDEMLDRLCSTFAEAIDAKSSYTFRHSTGVKDAAVAIGTAMGLPAARLQTLGRAALLHDIGKLGVPNTILDKPSALNAGELIAVREQPRTGRAILARARAFAAEAAIAGDQHERLDGSGYPHARVAEQLSLEARILAVADVYTALTEDRPHRPRLRSFEITAVMQRQVPGCLDASCYEALLSTLARPPALVAAHTERRGGEPVVAAAERRGAVPVAAALLSAATTPSTAAAGAAGQA